MALETGVVLSSSQFGGRPNVVPTPSGSSGVRIERAFELRDAAGSEHAEPKGAALGLEKETLREVLKKTADLVGVLSVDRHLKYEVIDEAGLVQIQVIDSRDGNVVRKIPADEIIKLVERIQETLNNRLDVTG